ncbi:MAG: glycoside hydrolase family 3 N-terminal domain-containing protein [Candidatus Hydrogenedentota bacterium]
MNVYHRRQKSRSTAASVITYVLLLAIGFSGGYVLQGIQEPAEPPELAEAPAERRDSPDEEPADITPEPAPEEDEAEPDEEEDAYPAGRHLIVGVRGTELDSRTRDMLRDVQPGGVLLSAANIEDEEQTRELVSEIKEAVGEGTGVADGPLIAVEQEGGDYNHLALPDAPAARQVGDTGEPSEAAALGGYFAQEARERGVGVLFAPVMDIHEPGGMAALETRAYGSELNVVTAMGIAFARGVMDEGLIPVAKHYPGYGAAQEPSGNGGIPVIEGDHAQLAEIMFPFLEASLRGAPGIMVGHIAVPALDLDHPDRPATMSPVLIQETLRERWNYEGVIVAEDMTRRIITSQYDSTEACIQALEAGADALVLGDPDVARIRGVVHGIERAVDEGRLGRDALEESRDRLEGWRALLRGDAPEEELPEIPSIDVEEYEGETAGLDAPLDDVEPLEEAEELEAPEEPEEPEEPAASEESQEPELELAEEGVRIEHEVQRGEYLSRIAERYGVSQDEIVEWNDLSSRDIQYGTTLVLYVPEERADAAPDEAESVEPLPEPPSEPPSAEAPAETDEEPVGLRAIEHTVQQGETLTRISERYGVSTSDIIEWNDLEDETIRWGFPLTIYVPEDAEFDE